MYQKDVTQALMPSAPSGQGQANAAKGSAMLAEAVIGGVKQGVSIFEDVKQGEFATKQTDLISTFEEEAYNLKTEGEKIKDIAPFFEDGAADDPALVAFKERQKAFLEASKQFPDKHKQMKQRSGTLLKEYIAKYPGLADEFRKSSADITGIGRLDLENLRELYTDVEWLQKKEADDAKATADALKEIQEAFVRTVTADKRMDEVNARVLARAITVKQMQQVAAAAQEQRNAEAAAEASLKQGGTQVQSYVNHRRTAWASSAYNTLGATFLQLQQLGVTRAAAMTPEALQKPEVKAVLEAGVSKYSADLDKYFAESMAAINASASRGDPNAVRQAVNDLQQWYDNEKKNLSPDNVWVKALTLDGQDDNKTIKERSELINSIQTGLRLDPLVLSTLLYGNPGSKDYEGLKAANPYAAKWIEWTRKARENLNGSSEEWAAVLADMRNLQGTGGGANPPGPPTTNSEKAAAALRQMSDIQEIRRIAQGQGGNESVEVINRFLANSLRTGGNAAMSKDVLPLISMALQQVPKSQQPAIQERIKNLTDNFIYGFNGDADIAKVRASSVQSRKDVVTSFADPSGSTPLTLGVYVSRPSVQVQGRSGVQQQAQPSLTGKVAEEVFSAIDNKLLLRAETTGEDIRVLRQQFMEVFNKDGVPSQNRTSALSNAATTRNNKPGVSLGEVVGVDVGGTALQGPASVVLRDLQLLVESTTDAATKTKLQAIIKDMQK